MGYSYMQQEGLYNQKLTEVYSLTSQKNNLDGQIIVMQQTISYLNQQISNLQQQNTSLQSQLTEAQNQATISQNREYQAIYPSVYGYPYNDYNYFQYNYPYDYNHLYNYWWLRLNPPSNGTSYGPWD
jgi:hypothetical protein